MAARRKSIGSAIIAAIVIATGLAVLWGLAGGWIASLVDMATTKHGMSEDIQVATDGTPVISVDSRVIANSVTMSRRTLDGKAFPVDYESWIGGGWLGTRNLVPGVIQLPVRWGFGQRILGGTDGRRPPSAWYIVRDGKPAGHIYFAGYDAFSKLPVGFIGRNGFQAAAPSVDEQFELPDTYEPRLESMVVASQQLSEWGMVWDHSLYEKAKPPGWLVFTAGPDKLWEVDLRRRTARVALDAPGLVSVCFLSALKDTFESAMTGGPVKPGQPASPPAVNGAQLGEVDKELKYVQLVCVRTDSKLVMFDPTSGRKKDFALPKGITSERLVAYWTAPDQVILLRDKGYWSGGPVQQLTWINGAGKTTREVDVKLAGNVPDSPRNEAWTFLAIVPVTIVWLVSVSIGAPLVMVQNYQAPDFASAIAESFRVALPPLVMLLVVSGVLAWVTLWLQRKNRRSSSSLWIAFVFLLGLPGFFAYLVEHRRTKLEACPQCGEIVPRDREACAACDTEFAPPPRVGTEIFA